MEVSMSQEVFLRHSYLIKNPWLQKGGGGGWKAAIVKLHNFTGSKGKGKSVLNRI